MVQDDSGNWWLKVNNIVTVGYWPKELLSSLNYTATIVQWGGQVFSTQIGKTPHTKTEMGSGESADGRLTIACYIKNARIKDFSKTLKYPKLISTYAQEPYCYGAINDIRYGEFPIFFFGGRGLNPPYCP